MRPAVAICWNSTGASVEVCPGRVKDSFEVHTTGVLIPLIVLASTSETEEVLAEKYTGRRFDFPKKGAYRIELEIVEPDKLAVRMLRISLGDSLVSVVYEDRFGPVRQRVRWRPLEERDHLAASMPSAWDQIGADEDEV